jgi:MFS family permease
MSFVIRRSWARVKGVYEDYPKPFWTLTFATFIDAVGGALIFPFLSLYITRRFQVGMTEVGILFGLYSAASIFGSGLGGALADRMGRKSMILSGLVISALSSLSIALVPSIEWFYLLVVFVGLFSNLGGPARQAMVADLLRPEKRAQGYSILRVIMNLSITIGPAIGGLLAARSYLLLFLSDATISILVAIFILRALPETRPVRMEKSGEEESLFQTFKGYGRVLRDRFYLSFIFGGILLMLVYMQMNTTLPVYLRDVHQISEQGYGLILSLNAGLVVLFQFFVTRKVDHRPPMLMMALGTAFYVVGFSMYGFTSTYPLFLLAMVIITIGEMIVAPVGQALVARMAPEDMRGRYMAIYGYTFTVASMTGPLLAGLVIDNFDPRILWYFAGIVGILAMMIFVLLYRQMNEETTSELQIPAAQGSD